MNNRIPEVLSIPKNGLWVERTKVQAVFLRRHNLDENLFALQSSVEQDEVQLSPQDWLFLLEGRKQYLSKENLFIESKADELSVTSADPIVLPFTKEIAESITIEETLAALSLLVLEYLDFVENEESVDEERLKEFLDLTIQALAKWFDIRAKALHEQFIKLGWNTPQFWEQVDVFRSNRQALVNKSNLLSRERLVQIIHKYKHKNVFIVSGIAHKPVFVG